MNPELQIIKVAFWVACAFTVLMFLAHCLLQYERS